MKIKYKTRKTISQVLSIVLVCALGLGAIFGVSALSKKLKEETKVIHPLFEVGGLDANGDYLETDESIYTKEAFECQGLEVKLDFDSNVTYQAYFYDELDNYISNSSEFEDSAAIDVPSTAVYARLVVTPIWADDVEDEDRVCHWYDVAKYSSQLEITVNKVQEEVINYGTVMLTYNNIEMSVVDSFEDLEFDYGRINLSVWADGTANASTVNYCVIVEGGETIKFDDKIGGVAFYVEEYTTNPIEESNLNENATNNGAWSTSDFTIQEDTQYIIVICKLTDGSDFTSAQVALLNECFDIS